MEKSKIKLVLAAVIFLFSKVSAQTVIIESIGAAVGRDYSTIAAWETATSIDLVTANEVRIGELYNDAVFNEFVDFSGATTDQNRYRKITTSVLDRHNGVKGTGVFIQETTNFSPMLQINEDYFKIEWVEIQNQGGAEAISLNNPGTSAEYLIIRDSGGIGLRMGSTSNGSAVVRNCIIYNCTNYGLVAIGDVYNSTIYNSGTGFLVSTGYTANSINVISVGNTVDFDLGTGSSWGASTSNNISSDATAPGTNSKTNISASSLFVSITSGSEDLHLKSGAPAIDAGLAYSGGEVDIDFELRNYGIATDIGADEYVVYSTTVNNLSDSVRQSSDDSWEKSDGTVDPTRLTIVLDYVANNWRWGLARFQNINIPQGAKIDSAALGIIWGQDTVSFDFYLFAEDIDSSNTLSGTLNEISSKTMTDNFVRWTDKSVFSTYTYSPNISWLVQELVNRPNWKAGNSISIIIKGLSTNGSPDGLAYDYQPGSSNPKIYIEWRERTSVQAPTKKVFLIQ